MIFKNLQFKKGFTLIEMLVVIAIIGILYLIVFGSVSDSKKRGRDSKRIADISVIQLALERYYDHYHNYPLMLNDTNLTREGPIPADPQNNVSYEYSPLESDGTTFCSTLTDCQSYELGASLELDNNILDDDKDKMSTDSSSCNGEQGKKCYDVAPKF